MAENAKRLLRALHGEAVSPPPIWLMRQAGRYLPEYRATRARAGSFLDLCYTPELAAEVTLQPIRRFGFDAAILFADILLVPHALGHDVRFVAGEGPQLDPVAERGGIGSLRPVDEIDAVLAPVYETVRRVRAALPPETALIGFAGAPWTVATYMVAGRGTPDQRPAREMAYREPERFAALIGRLTEATIHYLSCQIDAGAEVVKLFDSWAGSLAPTEFARWVEAPARRIVAALANRHPQVPVVGFPRGAGAMYPGYAVRTGARGLALDSAVPMDWARAAIPGVTLQGNLDPLLMVVGGAPMRAGARRLVETMQGVPYIFNLGHGITPEADLGHVADLVATVRGMP